MAKIDLSKAAVVEYVSQEIELRAEQFCVHQSIRKDVSVEECIMTGNYIIRMIARMFVREVEKVTYSLPSTWWQHFKYRYFKGKLLSRFPVEYTQHHHEVLAFYPDMVFPDHIPPRILIMKSPHSELVSWK